MLTVTYILPMASMVERTQSSMKSHHGLNAISALGLWKTCCWIPPPWNITRLCAAGEIKSYCQDPSFSLRRPEISVISRPSQLHRINNHLLFLASACYYKLWHKSILEISLQLEGNICRFLILIIKVQCIGRVEIASFRLRESHWINGMEGMEQNFAFNV